MTHICIGNLTIIGLDNGLSPGRCQAITWTNVGILLIGSLGINFSEMSIEIHTFSFKKIHWKMLSGKWRPFCLGLNMLTRLALLLLIYQLLLSPSHWQPSNGSWCMGIKGEMSGTVCVTFTWDMYIYIWVVYSLCFFCCLFITVTWWYVWCFEWASGNQEEVQACLVTLWLFIISCYSLYKTTLGLLCSWFENNPHFHKYSMDFHV